MSVVKERSPTIVQVKSASQRTKADPCETEKPESVDTDAAWQKLRPERPLSASKLTTAVISTGMLAIAFYIAYFLSIDSVPQALLFSGVSGLAFGGFANILGANAAEVTIGKWFKAGGVAAILLFFVLLCLNNFGVMQIKDMPKLGKLAFTQAFQPLT